MFVVCGFRERMCVLVVSIVLSCHCELITDMIIMILLFGLTWCLEFSSKYDTLMIIYYYYYY